MDTTRCQRPRALKPFAWHHHRPPAPLGHQTAWAPPYPIACGLQVIAEIIVHAICPMLEVLRASVHRLEDPYEDPGYSSSDRRSPARTASSESANYPVHAHHPLHIRP
ncbi:hypothetical protein HYPSUDRAFT_656786 [Hypholoma sublateritium FD-334 SS-4]|uniref:Uncharacterized protein n=1 Tax=Hypholoma sublateritium (strain FD-334 SS-4) TaxID=945553 RepID=A0A0D2NU70_HYPSF|nr:hypothetical protein HYPSUDRAFT_656786 [Hypholoma sublateritium FD-334 SS-4]